MQDQLVSFETAKLAKSKWFKIQTDDYYNTDNPIGSTIELKDRKLYNSIHKLYGKENPNVELLTTAAPTQSLLQRWLREVHKIEIYVSPHHTCSGYQMHFWKRVETHYSQSGQFQFKTYELALEAGLQEALKLIK